MKAVLKSIITVGQNISSDLYSLFDYKDFREKMDLEKAYLQGRFDAVPYINEFENI